MSWRVDNCDALVGLGATVDNCIQTCVTSPPYWGLRDYGVEGQIGLEHTPEEYVARLVGIFREVRRVLRKDGTLWLNMGDCYASAATDGLGRVGPEKRGYRGDRLPNGRGDQPSIKRVKTRELRTPEHAGKHKASMGGMVQPNRLPIPGLRRKNMVGIPWRLAFALQADGWYLRSDIIWAKPNPMPESAKDRPTRSHEYLFLFSKSPRYYYNSKAAQEPTSGRAHPRGKAGSPFDNTPSGWDNHSRSHRTRIGRYRSGNKARKLRGDNGGVRGDLHRSHQGHGIPWEDSGARNWRSVWHIATQPFPEAHFATFPPALARRCILAGSRPGDAVLDPFAGSGTAGMVALELGRGFLGFELSREYAMMARRRIAGPLFAEV